MIGRHRLLLRWSRKRHGHGAVCVALDRLHRPALVDRLETEVACDRLGQLLVAAVDVVALVRLSVDREVAGARVVAEQVHDVERRLILRFGSVLLVVRRVEQAPHRGAVAAGNVVLDPVVGGHVVEEDARVGVDLVRRRIARGLYLPLQRVVDRLEVQVGLLCRVVAVEEPVRVGGAVRLRGHEVVCRQVEALRQMADRHVIAVDQLAAELRDLPVAPVAGAIGMHPAADALGRGFVDGRGEPLVGEGQRGRQPGDASADDCDPRRRRRVRTSREGGRPCRHDRCARYPGALEELAARDLLLAPAAELGRRDPQPVGAAMFLGELLECAKQRRACHDDPPSWLTRERSRIATAKVKRIDAMRRRVVGIPRVAQI